MGERSNFLRAVVEILREKAQESQRKRYIIIMKT
jgi:hypothetical protein